MKGQFFYKAVKLFSGTGVQITRERNRQLGAVIDSTHFKHEYMEDTIRKGILEIGKLAKMRSLSLPMLHMYIIYKTN